MRPRQRGPDRVYHTRQTDTKKAASPEGPAAENERSLNRIRARQVEAAGRASCPPARRPRRGGPATPRSQAGKERSRRGLRSCSRHRGARPGRTGALQVNNAPDSTPAHQEDTPGRSCDELAAGHTVTTVGVDHATGPLRPRSSPPPAGSVRHRRPRQEARAQLAPHPPRHTRPASAIVAREATAAATRAIPAPLATLGTRLGARRAGIRRPAFQGRPTLRTPRHYAAASRIGFQSAAPSSRSLPPAVSSSVARS